MQMPTGIAHEINPMMAQRSGRRIGIWRLSRIRRTPHLGVDGSRIQAVHANAAGRSQFVCQDLHESLGRKLGYGVGSPVGSAFAADT